MPIVEVANPILPPVGKLDIANTVVFYIVYNICIGYNIRTRNTTCSRLIKRWEAPATAIVKSHVTVVDFTIPAAKAEVAAL